MRGWGFEVRRVECDLVDCRGQKGIKTRNVHGLRVVKFWSAVACHRFGQGT